MKRKLTVLQALKLACASLATHQDLTRQPPPATAGHSYLSCDSCAQGLGAADTFGRRKDSKGDFKDYCTLGVASIAIEPVVEKRMKQRFLLIPLQLQSLAWPNWAAAQQLQMELESLSVQQPKACPGVLGQDPNLLRSGGCAKKRAGFIGLLHRMHESHPPPGVTVTGEARAPIATCGACKDVLR